MSQEVERTIFRPGENAKRPYWGNVTDVPFAQILRRVAIGRGYISQKSLAEALGRKSNGLVYKWSSDRSIPSAETFGKIIVLFQPHDGELELLIEAYAQEISKRTGANEVWGMGVERRLKMIKSSETLVGRWIEDYCINHRKTFSDFIKLIGMSSKSSKSQRDKLGLLYMNAILDNVNMLEPSEEEERRLVDAIEETKKKRLEEGREFREYPTSLVRTMQKKVGGRTYNGQQAGDNLDISREWVRKLRRKFGYQRLLTDEDLEVLRSHLEQTKQQREKHQESRRKNQPKSLPKIEQTIFELASLETL